jgi:hypothetical protein
LAGPDIAIESQEVAIASYNGHSNKRPDEIFQ